MMNIPKPSVIATFTLGKILIKLFKLGYEIIICSCGLFACFTTITFE